MVPQKLLWTVKHSDTKTVWEWQIWRQWTGMVEEGVIQQVEGAWDRLEKVAKLRVGEKGQGRVFHIGAKVVKKWERTSCFQ